MVCKLIQIIFKNLTIIETGLDLIQVLYQYKTIKNCHLLLPFESLILSRKQKKKSLKIIFQNENDPVVSLYRG